MKKKINLLILKHLLEGQGFVGTLSGDEGAGRHCICVPLSWQHYWVCPSQVLFHCLIKHSKHTLALCFPTALGKLMETCSPYRGCSLMAWLWGSGRLVFLDLLGLKQSEKTVHGRQPFPGQYIAGWHIKSFCDKGLLTCLGASIWGADFRFAIHPEATDVFAGNKGWGTRSLHSPPGPWQFTSTIKKERYTFIWSHNFATITWVIPDRIVQRPAGFTTMV